MIVKYLKIILYPVVLIIRLLRVYNIGRSTIKWPDRIEGGEILIRMNLPRGKFYLDPKSHLLLSAINGEYEKRIMKLVEGIKIDNGIILNIGANIGFYSVHLANSFAHNEIISVEPNPEAYGTLKKNVEINNLINRIKIFNVCISDKTGTIPFTIIRGKSEYSSINDIIHKSVIKEKKEVIEVKSFTLKEITQGKKISLILMDVEGSEHLILENSKEIIEKDRPYILCECNDSLLKKFGSSSLKLTLMLNGLGYNVMNAEAKRKKIRHPFVGNIICFPQENMAKNM
jgi:FkbM family methyltransferase